jgi:Tetratricopeptide repeat
MSVDDSGVAGQIPTTRLLAHVVEATAHPELLGAVPRPVVRVLSTVVIGLMEAGQLDTARPLLKRAVAIALGQLGADHPATFAARSNLASWLGEAGQVDQAITEFRQLLEDRTRVLGADHPRTSPPATTWPTGKSARLIN